MVKPVIKTFILKDGICHKFEEDRNSFVVELDR
jgi:hypothetical protein